MLKLSSYSKEILYIVSIVFKKILIMILKILLERTPKKKYISSLLEYRNGTEEYTKPRKCTFN